MPRGKLVGVKPAAHVKFSPILTPGQDVTILAGTPIGLLMALTYPVTFVLHAPDPIFKGISPRASIKTTD